MPSKGPCMHALDDSRGCKERERPNMRHREDRPTLTGDAGAHKAGYMLKHGRNTRWDRRYFVLKGSELAYWHNASCRGEPVQTSLSAATKIRNSPRHARHAECPFLLELVPADDDKDRSHLVLCGETLEETRSWAAHLQARLGA